MSNRNLELALRIRTLVQGDGSIEDLRRDMGELADEIENADGPTRELNDGLNDLDESGRKAGRSIKAAADPMAQLKELLSDIAVAALAKQILDLNDQMTALKRGFDVITGSTEKTGEALAFVRGVADKLGVGVNDLAQSYLKLTAASKGTQLEGAATEQIFSSLAGAMSVVGAGTQEVDQAMTALAQIMSKGVVSAEELRGQLGDVLPGAAQQAANSLLVTNAEFSKMLESGEIIASEFLPKFAAQIEKAMGAGAGQAQTFGAAWSRLTNQLADLATGPVGAGFTSFVAGLTEKLGLLVRGAGFVSDAIGAVGRALGGIAAGEPGAALEDLGQSAENAALKLYGIKTAAEQAAATQKQMEAELRTLLPELDRFQDAVGRRELKDLPEYLQAAVAEFRKTGDAVAATEQAVSKFLGGVAQNLNFDGVIRLAGALQAVGQEAKGAGADIQNTLAAALEKLTDEQLVKLKEQAESAMAAASKGSDTARKAFADLGLVVDAAANVQLKRAAEQAGKLSEAMSGYARGLDGVARAQVDGLKAEIALAKARGDGLTVSQKSIELARIEADWARSSVAAKNLEIDAEKKAVAAEIAKLEATKATNAEEEETRQLQLSGLRLRQQALELSKSTVAAQAEEAAASAELAAKTQAFVAAGYDEIEAKRLALLASGQFTAALKIEEEQRKKTAETTGKQTEATEAATAATEDQAAAIADTEREARRTAPVMSYLAEAFGALNDKGRAALDAIGGDALLKGASNAIRMAQATTDLARKLDEAAQAEIAFGAEVAALQDVAGGVGEEADRARQKLIEMAFAGAQGIDGITRSGEEAVRALEDIKRATEEAEAALAGLAADFRKQILQIQGDQKALLDLEYQDNLRKLEELSARAGELGRDEYERAKAEAEDLHRLKLKQLKEQDEARNKQNSTATTGGQTAGGGAGGITTVNNTFLIDPAKLADEEWVRRNVIPTLDRVSRLRG